jgi:hypothetical protein
MMPQHKAEQHDDKMARTEELDSPTILNLIEQLENDLAKTNRNSSKTHLRVQAL